MSGNKELKQSTQLNEPKFVDSFHILFRGKDYDMKKFINYYVNDSVKLRGSENGFDLFCGTKFIGQFVKMSCYGHIYALYKIDDNIRNYFCFNTEGVLDAIDYMDIRAVREYNGVNYIRTNTGSIELINSNANRRIIYLHDEFIRFDDMKISLKDYKITKLDYKIPINTIKLIGREYTINPQILKIIKNMNSIELFRRMIAIDSCLIELNLIDKVIMTY